MLLVVAAIAYGAGVAGANGTLARLLADAHVPGVSPTSTATPALASTATAPSAGTPLHANTAPTGANAASGTDSASATPRARATDTATASPTATETALPKPPAVLNLQQSKAGGPLPANGWTGAHGVTLTVMAPPSQIAMIAEIEIRPAGQSFTGKPTSAVQVRNGVAAVALTGLSAGRYHWQARLNSAGGDGDWTGFAHGGTAFGVNLTPPPAPSISSPTNPRPDTTYSTSTVRFTWSAPADPAGITGYSYRLDTDPHGEALPVMRTEAQEVALGNLGTGVYYFHVRAVDGTGNWSQSRTYPVHIDVTPPKITDSHVSGYYINPSLEAITLTYTLSKVSKVTVGIYDNAGTRIRHIVPTQLMPAGIPLHVSWDGRDNGGTIVPPGMYTIYLRATDRLGNSNVISWGGYNVTDKRIVVSLSQERLWAYQGNNLLLTTLVTTGNKELPTPTGVFHIMFARHPFTFISMWPKGSKFWYPPSPVHYALYFKDYGYYIHDAPWRHFYGPGSDSVDGQPGNPTTGTHGCVNVPLEAMIQLYKWATPGTAVQIVA